ncbi:ATP-binding cassette subfamily B protein/ATP-binding cassette subfamily C protein [Allocatelliglobosispora scoriae]|uniref:ATP-binding cassette subfamily B protein/ATP-binding cassette subfamily C protein n=1 Tax=Allocatelliglobosispora scoriae TaxID=643052 RepID=A0A841BQU2_9ACTN|nr:ABC transporter ATP-binding protein [Allocatelliglobosispora scoriae]MBB5869559.1 ATP-binding cassette subfamily B protein/ATP-binding cassette subfamily C protein [Allocatelliglobosispora scoriae]
MPPEPAQPKVGLRTLGPYVRAHRGSLIVVGILSLITAGGTLMQPLLTRDVLDALGAGDPIGRAVGALVAVLLFVAALDGIRSYLLQRTAEGLVLTARRRLATHLLRLPIAEYDGRRTGDLLSRVGADSTLLRAVVTSGLFETVTGALMVVGAATAMILLDPVLFAVTLGGLAIGLAGGVFFARKVRGMSADAQARIGEMTSAVERAISAARTIRASRAEERETATVVESARQAYDAGLRIAKLQAILGPAMVTTVQASFLLVLGVGGARVASGTISVGDLVAFILFVFFLVMPLGQALNAYTQLQAGLGALGRMEEILEVPLEAAVPLRGSAAPSPGAPAVEFRDVSYGYATSADTVLREVTFTVPAGTRTALVGPSGAGKSTLLSLVERFYEIDSGELLINGVDVRALRHDELRAQLGYVEQEAPVLAGTLRENLQLATPAATDAQMLDVLRAVNLSDLAERTPLGLGEQVGEGGVLLSGGERQRLAIARALLSKPPILLLDEPTSNLDARNEMALRSAIDTVSTGRTLLIVAHRLSTVVDADQIVVLDQGRVVATGTHTELLTSSALYREFAEHQLLVPAAA